MNSCLGKYLNVWNTNFWNLPKFMPFIAKNYKKLLHLLWRLWISPTRWSNDSLFFGETISGKRASLAHFGRWVGSLLKELTCDKELHNSSVLLQQQTPKTRFFKRLRQKTEQQVRKFLNNLKMILCTVIAKNLVWTLSHLGLIVIA